MKCARCKEVEVKDYEPEFCCNGRECGCMGVAIEPPLCDECWKEVLKPSIHNRGN